MCHGRNPMEVGMISRMFIIKGCIQGRSPKDWEVDA